MTQWSLCPTDVQKRILDAIAKEQEQLARILTALADKVEKSAKWLPDTMPGEPLNVIVDKVKSLEAVIAQELKAMSLKEDAIKGILEQLNCCRPKRDVCPCPCESFQICKIVTHCVKTL